MVWLGNFVTEEEEEEEEAAHDYDGTARMYVRREKRND